MKILHLCLANFYSDGFAYQENELPKFHKALGHEVEIVASPATFNTKGEFTEYSGKPSYINENGIPVTRLRYKEPVKVWRILRRYRGTMEALELAAPDVLFIHGCQFSDADVVVDYVKRHPDTKVYVDNHADFKNSAKNFLSKTVLHGRIWKRCAQKLAPYTTKFYGVLPARVDFLTEAYDLPRAKCELLVMGTDDETANAARSPEVRKRRRREYGCTDKDFVIVTGGKIDHNKPQVLTFMKAVNTLAAENLKLVVFGSVNPELKDEFERSLSERVTFIGWRKPSEIYDDLAAADLVAFPGLHSVLWEEAVGMGKPCVFKRIDGFTHVDLGGNCLFFENDTQEEYKNVITEAINNISSLKNTAEEKGPQTFSYSAIAKRSLED